MATQLKRILVRSLAGVGSMAAYLVGGPGGFGGVSGQLDNSVLLRERIASNAGLAGEQEVEGLAANENIVVSVPGNTRFFIVLLEGSGQPARTAPTGARGASQIATNANTALPSAEELQELIELKTELNRMYQQVAATRTASTTDRHSNSNLHLKLCIVPLAILPLRSQSAVNWAQGRGPCSRDLILGLLIP